MMLHTFALVLGWVNGWSYQEGPDMRVSGIRIGDKTVWSCCFWTCWSVLRTWEAIEAQKEWLFLFFMFFCCMFGLCPWKPCLFHEEVWVLFLYVRPARSRVPWMQTSQWWPRRNSSGGRSGVSSLFLLVETGEGRGSIRINRFVNIQKEKNVGFSRLLDY